MKFLIAFLAAASSAWAADAVPMDVKTGQWEATVTSQFSGLPQGRTMPQIPPEQLAKLPPEQRAKVEAALKMASGAPRTTASRSCVRKEDLTRIPLNNDQSCKYNLVSSSSSKQEVHMDCDRNGNKQSGTMIIEAVSPETIKFTVQASASSSGQNMNMNITGSSKWVGPVCAESK